jgi:stearoyl-CoA desaturase (delta-9 desaturase)
MSWFRLVWDLRAPPAAIMAGDRPVGRKVVEKVAKELASTFNVESISLAVREALEETQALEDLSERARRARTLAEERLAEFSLPHLPTIPELRDKAEEMFNESPSLDAIVNRAHELLAEMVAEHVYEVSLAST